MKNEKELVELLQQAEEWCSDKPRWIVCAANRHPDNKSIVIPSARHFDLRMRMLICAMRLNCELSTRWEQGFIDQFGMFHTREEAYEIAGNNGQLKPDCCKSLNGKLYSEDLY